MNTRALSVTLMLLLPALCIHLIPSFTPVALYTRADLQHGQLWRLWTCHWVHFSNSHFFWNALVLVPVVYQLEKLCAWLALHVVLLAAPLISLCLWLGSPDMHSYGGLSALNICLSVSLAILLYRKTPHLRIAIVSTLAILAIKIACEAFSQHTFFARLPSEEDVRPSALSHALGLFTAALLALRLPGKISANTSTPHQTHLVPPPRSPQALSSPDA